MKFYYRFIRTREHGRALSPPSCCRDQTELRSEGGAEGRTGRGHGGRRYIFLITLWFSLINAIKSTLFAGLTFFSTQSRTFSLVLTCTDDTLQLPPALHAFRASPLPGFYPTFHGMDAINDPSCFNHRLDSTLKEKSTHQSKPITLWN